MLVRIFSLFFKVSEIGYSRINLHDCSSYCFNSSDEDIFLHSFQSCNDYFFQYVTQPMFMYIVISYLLCDVTFMYTVLNSQNVSNWYHFGVFLLFETRLQNHESEIMIRYLENSMYFFLFFIVQLLQ